MKENLYLIGFMGVGKSAVSRLLSERLSAVCTDTDAEIVTRAGKEITEIFDEAGEEAFRDLETGVLKDLAGKGGAVVSCGGGLVLREENRRLMKESGRTIWLTASPETIYERVHRSKNRPLLNGNMNVPYIAKLMAEREERYRKAADMEFSTDGMTAAEVAEGLYRILFPRAQSSGDAS